MTTEITGPQEPPTIEGPLIGPSGEQGKTFAKTLQAAWKLAVKTVSKTVGYATACDIGQEVSTKIFEKRRLEPGFLKGWELLRKYVITVAWSFAGKDKRSQKRSAKATVDFLDRRVAYLEWWMNPAAALALKEALGLVRWSVIKMPKRQREVFTLFHDDCMEPEEIAQALNIAEGTVRVQLSGALKAVVRYLIAHEASAELMEPWLRCALPKKSGDNT
jgi:RNA polymerase sigma-19 factor, ECF subfamily